MDSIAPTVTAGDWLANADQALTATIGYLQSIPGSTSVWAWAAGAGLLVLGVARKFLPGIYGWGADVLYNLLAPKADKEVERRKQTLAAAAERIIFAIEALPKDKTIGDLRESLKGVTTSEIRAEIERVRTRAAADWQKPLG